MYAKQTVPYISAPPLAPPVEKTAKAKPGAAPELPAVEGTCLDRPAALLQVGGKRLVVFSTRKGKQAECAGCAPDRCRTVH